MVFEMNSRHVLRIYLRIILECRKACPGVTHKLISKHTCLGLENLYMNFSEIEKKLIDKIFVEL